jgi:hypothetical protein
LAGSGSGRGREPLKAGSGRARPRVVGQGQVPTLQRWVKGPRCKVRPAVAFRPWPPERHTGPTMWWRRRGAVCETAGFSRRGIPLSEGPDLIPDLIHCRIRPCMKSRRHRCAAPRPALPAPGSALGRPARRARAVPTARRNTDLTGSLVSRTGTARSRRPGRRLSNSRSSPRCRLAASPRWSPGEQREVRLHDRAGTG